MTTTDDPHHPPPQRDPRSPSLDAWIIARALVEKFGREEALEQITSALFLPAPDTLWVYDSDGAPLVFQFVRLDDDRLIFDGPFGFWSISRAEWIDNLAFRRVRKHDSVTDGAGR